MIAGLETLRSISLSENTFGRTPSSEDWPLSLRGIDIVQDGRRFSWIGLLNG